MNRTRYLRNFNTILKSGRLLYTFPPLTPNPGTPMCATSQKVLKYNSEYKQ
jgi:hypothetical protein